MNCFRLTLAGKHLLDTLIEQCANSKRGEIWATYTYLMDDSLVIQEMKSPFPEGIQGFEGSWISGYAADTPSELFTKYFATHGYDWTDVPDCRWFLLRKKP